MIIMTGINQCRISIIVLAVGRGGTWGVGTLIVNGMPNKDPSNNNRCRSDRNAVSGAGTVTATISAAAGAAVSADAATKRAEAHSGFLQFDADSQLDHTFDGDFEILYRTTGIMR